MATRVLDTNILINHWYECARDRPLREITRRMAERWAGQLGHLHGTVAILTPIYVEYICGVQSRHQLELARSYLGAFPVADEGQILKQDWQYAERLASRVPADGLRRQMGDCLIRAICERLHLEPLTAELRYPHRMTGGRR